MKNMMGDFFTIFGMKSPFPPFCLGFHLSFSCFIADLLRQIVVSSTVDCFVGFRVNNSYGKVSIDRVIISNHVHQYAANLESFLSIFLLSNM